VHPIHAQGSDGPLTWASFDILLLGKLSMSTDSGNSKSLLASMVNLKKEPRRLSTLVRFASVDNSLHSIPPLWRSKRPHKSNNTRKKTVRSGTSLSRKIHDRIPMPLLSSSKQRAARAHSRVCPPQYHEWTHTVPRARRRLTREQFALYSKEEGRIRRGEQEILSKMLRVTYAGLADESVSDQCLPAAGCGAANSNKTTHQETGVMSS